MIRPFASFLRAIFTKFKPKVRDIIYEHTLSLAYLELLSKLLDDFFAFLFLLVEALLFGLKELLVPTLSIF